MLEETADLIALLRPRAYLIGNVPGLQDSTSWHVVQRVIGGLGRFGYCVADYAQLDAADYGVPQHRVRPFWYGHLGGPCVRWPAPTHGNPAHPSLPGLELKPWVTCRQALEHLDVEELGRPVRLRRHVADGHPCATADDVAPTIRGGGDGHSAPEVLLASERHPMSRPDEPARGVRASRSNTGAQGGAAIEIAEPRPNHPASRLDEPSHVIKCNGGRASMASSTLLLSEHGERHVTRADEPANTVTARDNRKSTVLALGNKTPAGADEPHRTVTAAARGQQAAVEWPWDRPATTIVSKDSLAPPGHHERWPWNRPSTTVCAGIDKISPANEHQGQFGPNAVVLSERAAAILQGFPETWRFCGKTKRARWSQIGMAMPPALAEAVARSVKSALAASISSEVA